MLEAPCFGVHGVEMGDLFSRQLRFYHRKLLSPDIVTHQEALGDLIEEMAAGAGIKGDFEIERDLRAVVEALQRLAGEEVECVAENSR